MLADRLVCSPCVYGLHAEQQRRDAQAKWEAEAPARAREAAWKEFADKLQTADPKDKAELIRTFDDPIPNALFLMKQWTHIAAARAMPWQWHIVTFHPRPRRLGNPVWEVVADEPAWRVDGLPMSAPGSGDTACYDGFVTTNELQIYVVNKPVLESGPSVLDDVTSKGYTSGTGRTPVSVYDLARQANPQRAKNLAGELVDDDRAWRVAAPAGEDVKFLRGVFDRATTGWTVVTAERPTTGQSRFASSVRDWRPGLNRPTPTESTLKYAVLRAVGKTPQ